MLRVFVSRSWGWALPSPCQKAVAKHFLMTRSPSHSTNKRRLRSRLRLLLDELLTQKPMPIRQERQVSPQVRLLESRFVLDASAALLGLDAANAGWETQAEELQSEASVEMDALSVENQAISTTLVTPGSDDAVAVAGYSAGKDSGSNLLTLGAASGQTDQFTVISAPSDPQLSVSVVESDFVRLDSSELSISHDAGNPEDESGTHVMNASGFSAFDQSIDDVVEHQTQSSPDATEIVFIDAGVQDHETLTAGFREGVEVLILDGSDDGVSQISQALEDRADLDAIHIISHGSAGRLQLGSTVLESDSISRYAEALSQIGSSLTDSGDLMLYGCDVAQGQVGETFISALATATDADVAASNDRTGDAELHGDWVLESSSGDVGTAALIDESVRTGYAYVLLEPQVLSVEVSDTSITDSDAGSSFDVTVTFDQAMNTALAFQPVLTFDPDVLTAGTLMNPSAGTWSVGDTVFTRTFDIADVGVEVANIEIDVTGAQNPLAEAQADYTAFSASSHSVPCATHHGS